MAENLSPSAMGTGGGRWAMVLKWRLRLLGGWRIEGQGGVVGRLETRKAELLLAWLALHPRRAVDRDVLAELFWPDTDLARARNCLSSHLHLVRRLLEPSPAYRGTVLCGDHRAVQLRDGVVETDVAVFETLATAARRAEHALERQHYLGLAVSAYGGELLPGRHDPWLLPERRRLAAGFTECAGELVAGLEAEQGPLAALAACREALGKAPLSETLHHEVIRLSLAAGRAHEAVEQYHDLEAMLAAEYGTAPDPRTRALLPESAFAAPVPRSRRRAAARREPSADARLAVLRGEIALREGDLGLALGWFAQALATERDPAAADLHQLRLTLTLRQCPRIEHLWADQSPARAVALDGKSERVAAGYADGRVRLFHLTRGAEQSAWQAHEGMVTRLAFAPGAGLLLSAGTDGLAVLWDLPARQRPRRLVHGAPITDASFDRAGTRLVTAGEDGVARLWDLSSGTETGVCAHQADICAAVFSPDGEHLATASRDGTARIWVVADGRPVGAPPTHDGVVYDVQFSPDGAWVATAGGDAVARVWRIDGEPVTPPLRHAERAVRGVAFLAGGARLATASHDGTARLWELPSGYPAGTLVADNERMAAVGLSWAGRHVLVLGAHGRAWVAPAEPTGRPAVPLWHTAPLCQAAFSPHDRRVATACDDGLVRIWDTATPPPEHAPVRLSHEESIHVARAVVSPDGLRVLTCATDGRARLWSLDGAPLSPWLVHDGPVWDGLFSPDGAWLATAGRDGRVRLWDPSGRELAVLTGHEHSVRCLALSSDGARLASACRDGTVRLWSPSDGAPVAVLRHPGQARWVCFSPDGRTVATACDDGRVRRWCAATGEPIGSPACHGGDVTWVGFSPNGRRLASTAANGTVAMWDATEGERVSSWSAHRSSALMGAFSPDGAALLTVSSDATARLWRVDDGAPQCEPLEHDKWVCWGAFSGDGRLVATGGDDAGVRLWETATGSLVGPPFILPGIVNHVSFSPDGGRLAAACSDGAAWLFDLTTAGRGVADWLSQADLLAGRRWTGESGAVEALTQSPRLVPAPS